MFKFKASRKKVDKLTSNSLHSLCLPMLNRDMRKPINILTGLDYWLDNLMCNVPELAMCYHDNGIVQARLVIMFANFPLDLNFSKIIFIQVSYLVVLKNKKLFLQSYELLKTEEIPNMTDSKFSPNVVKDVAQNILSFLKSSTTKEGHTYWLFKGKYY